MANDNGNGKRELEIIGTATSLDDGMTYEAEIVVELPNDKAIIYKMRTLSVGEWDDIGRTVPQPGAPVSGFKKGSAEPIYNERDAGYLAACAAADAERSWRRLAAALLIDIPGDTLEQKAEAIGTKMDASVTRQLMSALLSLTFGGVSRIDRRAESFHTIGTGHPEGAPDAEYQDERGVGSTADE